MTQGLIKRKPPSTSYRETFRRHRALFWTPVILGALAAAIILFWVAKSYTSTAGLWIDTAPPAQSDMGTGLAMAEPPAAAMQGILTELLTTNAFASSVAKTSLLGTSLGSAAAIQANAQTRLGGGQVVQTVQGTQLLTLSYSASSQAMATSVLRAIVTQLRDYTESLTAIHNKAALAYDRDQVNAAERALAIARINVSAYQAHHRAVSASDPQYASLIAAESNAETQLTQANTALSQASGTNGSANGWSIQVIDPPHPATTSTLRKSKIAEVILGGAFGGLLVSFLVVVALTPAKKEVWEDELGIEYTLNSDVPPGEPLHAESRDVAPASAKLAP